MMALVVARNHRALSFVFDHNLRRAEDVPGRHQPHRDISGFEWFAIGKSLHGVTRHRAKPDFHDGHRVSRGKNRLMAGPRMVGMAMGDDGALNGRMRIDVEIARHAIETARIRSEPCLKGTG